MTGGSAPRKGGVKPIDSVELSAGDPKNIGVGMVTNGRMVAMVHVHLDNDVVWAQLRMEPDESGNVGNEDLFVRSNKECVECETFHWIFQGVIDAETHIMYPVGSEVLMVPDQVEVALDEAMALAREDLRQKVMVHGVPDIAPDTIPEHWLNAADDPDGPVAALVRDAENLASAVPPSGAEAGDDAGVWPDQSAQHAVLLEQIKDAYAEGKADAVALIRERAANALPEVARFTLDEIEAIVALAVPPSGAEAGETPLVSLTREGREWAAQQTVDDLGRVAAANGRRLSALEDALKYLRDLVHDGEVRRIIDAALDGRDWRGE